MTIITNQAGSMARSIVRSALAVACLLLCFAAVLPAFADAKTYVQVETFGGVLTAGGESEEAQLQGVGALAVNSTGAGGVPKGTMYAAVNNGFGFEVKRFEPKIVKEVKEGNEVEVEQAGLKFVEGWEARTEPEEKARELAGKEPYEICGPAVVSESLRGLPSCASPLPGERAGAGEMNAARIGIAVDQTTGNVYFSFEVSAFEHQEGIDLIAEYLPNGSEVITRFGKKGPGAESSGHTVAETPEKIHESPAPSPMAVNDDGEVYFADQLAQDNFFHRLMVFKPTAPGDYTEYEYAGRSRDVGAGTLAQSSLLQRPLVDADGNIFASSDNTVEQFDPAHPATPSCSFRLTGGGITATTVDPSTGAPFVYTPRRTTKAVPAAIRQLSACEGGAFRQIGEIVASPERGALAVLAYDPVRQLTGREAGILYAATPVATPVEGPGQPGTSALGYIFAQPEERPPAITGESVDQVTAKSAVLSAQIDPNGFPSEYAFQYQTRAAYEDTGSFADAAEVTGTVEGTGVRTVVATATALMPGTSYVFRVVAVSNCAADPLQACPTKGATVEFQTYPTEGAGLPDGRAYELVSPAQKQGGQVLPGYPEQKSCSVACKPGEAAERFPAQSTPDGGSVVYEGEPFGLGGSPIENEYRSVRSASGWETDTLSPGKFQPRDGNGYKAFNPDLTQGIFSQSLPPLSPSALTGYRNIYLQSTGDPLALSPLLSSTNATPSCPQGIGIFDLKPTYMGASVDLARVFLQVNDALTPEAVGTCGQSNLYEWAAGALRSVNILPAGTKSTPGAVLGSGTLLASGNPNSPAVVVSHAISDDGSKAFFTGADGRLYARMEGIGSLEVPSPGNCTKATALSSRVCFLTASADGTRVLLSNGSSRNLNDSSTAYEPAVDLTQGKGGFQGLVGQDEDLTTAYFVDTAILTGAEVNGHGASAVAGAKNLYAWSDGATRFIAVLAPSDGISVRGDWAASPAVRTAEASPNGRWLAFQSVSPLTGYANGGVREAFIYDSQANLLVCASCNASGAQPVGPATLRTMLAAGGQLAQPRYLTDAGRLYFDSGDRLVPSDSNGAVEDVYEYEPAGVGSCTEAGACVALISTGRGSSDSNFLVMDQGGDNVFFTTRNQLLPADKDEAIDLYDARVGGGFPEPPTPSECQGEACQQMTVPLALSAPTSAGVAGEAPVRVKCKKGQVRRKGHCVKKSPKKKHKARHKQARRGGGNR